MNKQTATNLFIVPPLATYAGFYQELLKGFVSYEHLGNRLIRLGEQAHAFRQFDNVKEIGQLLSNIPIKHCQQIGLYFLAVAANNNGSGDQQKARKLFEIVADAAPVRYRAKAMLALSAVSSNTRDFQSQYWYLLECGKASVDISTTVRSCLGLAIYKSMEGFHSSALKDFENLYALARLSEPIVYFDYLNSYAVELGETGRKDEARNISRVVLASPFAHAYPEWQETARDLKEPNRSFVAVPSIEPEPVEIEATQSHHASEPDQPATILAFPKLKEAPKPEKPKRLTPQEVAELTPGDMQELLLAAIKAGTIQESNYIKMMNWAGLLKNGPAAKVIDLEDDAVLDDLIVVWAHQVDPEELVAVLSALRDCDDSFRRNNIINTMIRIAFQETQECGLTEMEWRNRVERRLPKK
jgi:tetratricopeptide (TPR) repeat protein